jgi:methylisocitrate lyase
LRRRRARRHLYIIARTPVSALRVAAKAQESLYVALKRDGDVRQFLGQMMTRQQLYETINYFDYETLDASIVKTILP